MSPNELRRKLKDAGFRLMSTHKRTERWAFRDIFVSLPDHVSRNVPHEIDKAIRKAKIREEVEPKPLTAKLADQFQKDFREKAVKRAYFCGLAGCYEKFDTPEQLAEHKKTHTTSFAAPIAPPPPEPPEPTFEPVAPAHKLGPAAMGFRRFSSDERKSLFGDIKPLVDAGMTYLEVAQKWNGDKKPSPNGIPWTEQMISNFMFRYKKAKKREREKHKLARQTSAGPMIHESPPTQTPVVTAPKTGNKLPVPASIQLMMDDTELSVEQKVAVLTAAKIQIPASLQLVLEDPALDTEQKHRIFMMLIGTKG